MSRNIPRHAACFPISVVQELTSLSARQIRYYEAQNLIRPARNKGNQRLFSLADIDRCAEIKELIDQGLNIAGVKAVLYARENERKNKEPISKKIVNDKTLKTLLPHVKRVKEESPPTHKN